MATDLICPLLLATCSTFFFIFPMAYSCQHFERYLEKLYWPDATAEAFVLYDTRSVAHRWAWGWYRCWEPQIPRVGVTACRDTNQLPGVRRFHTLRHFFGWMYAMLSRQRNEKVRNASNNVGNKQAQKLVHNVKYIQSIILLIQASVQTF